MRAAGEKLMNPLKSRYILTRKPDLNLCSNHFKEQTSPKRIWNRGTAVKDGKGWYKPI